MLYPSYLAITLISLVAFTWYATLQIENLYLEQKAESLFEHARIVREVILDKSDWTNNIQDTLTRLKNESALRFTIIAKNGTVLADTDEKPDEMENHADRPEIKAAYKGNRGTSTRYSFTLEQEMMYVAIPLEKQEIKNVIRVSQSINSILAALNSIYMRIFIAFAGIAVFAAMMSLFVSTLIQRPLKELSKSMKEFSSGNLDHRVPQGRTYEFSSLADSANEMAAELVNRIEDYSRQKNEQDAILSSMIEGVIAVDTNERILKINNAAAGFLNTSVKNSVGKLIHETVRNSELLDFVAETLSSNGDRLERNIVFKEDTEKYFQVHGTRLTDQNGVELGALIVLNDVTRLRKLESIRKDFVANVSHELKTPITSIKASAETLFDNHLEDEAQKKDFLNIIIKGADRLYAIIEDLLSLSRIEQQSETTEIEMDEHLLADSIEAAVKTCEKRAKEKNIDVKVKCPKSRKAAYNEHLIEQALVNLIDNAIKYSEKDKSVHISCGNDDGYVTIEVRDEGFGIDEEHFPRLFERFYRIDKARSRNMGGTGLGLAIVKHIVEAHRGKITVESRPKKGSAFTLHLPE